MLITLWGIYALTRNVPSGRGPIRAITVGLSSFGIAGIFYFVAFAASLVCCGVEGMNFINSNLFAVIAIGFILGLPLALKKVQ